MPIDTQTYLRNNGWQGHGTALREGALARPLSIPQKRTLAGVGKDRDEAFPFWDHVFAAASSAIQIKLGSDDEASDSESTPRPELRRTTTGIISNKRPPTGIIADHSLSTTTHPLSVMAIAKRTAARKNLYSRFFKGPVLGPDATEKEMVQTEKMSMEEKVHAGHEDMRDALEHAHVVHHDEGQVKERAQKERKRKREAKDEDGEVKEGGKTKRSKEEKELRRAEKAQKRAKKEARHAAKASASTIPAPSTSTSAAPSKSASAEPEPIAADDDAKATKRRAKEGRRKAPAEAGAPAAIVDEKEKRRAEKEERKARKLAKEAESRTEEGEAAGTKHEADEGVAGPLLESAEEATETEHKKKRRREVAEEASSAAPAETEKKKKKKKRRKEPAT